MNNNLWGGGRSVPGTKPGVLGRAKHSGTWSRVPGPKLKRRRCARSGDAPPVLGRGAACWDVRRVLGRPAACWDAPPRAGTPRRVLGRPATCWDAPPRLARPPRAGTLRHVPATAPACWHAPPRAGTLRRVLGRPAACWDAQERPEASSAVPRPAWRHWHAARGRKTHEDHRKEPPCKNFVTMLAASTRAIDVVPIRGYN